MRYRLWKMSQSTNTVPSPVPTVRPIQYQDGSRVPLRTVTATVTSAANPATPRTGFREPEHLGLAVLITDPQLSSGLMLQLCT